MVTVAVGRPLPGCSDGPSRPRCRSWCWCWCWCWCRAAAPCRAPEDPSCSGRTASATRGIGSGGGRRCRLGRRWLAGRRPARCRTIGWCFLRRAAVGHSGLSRLELPPPPRRSAEQTKPPRRRVSARRRATAESSAIIFPGQDGYVGPWEVTRRATPEKNAPLKEAPKEEEGQEMPVCGGLEFQALDTASGECRALTMRLRLRGRRVVRAGPGDAPGRLQAAPLSCGLGHAERHLSQHERLVRLRRGHGAAGGRVRRRRLRLQKRLRLLAARAALLPGVHARSVRRTPAANRRRRRSSLRRKTRAAATAGLAGRRLGSASLSGDAENAPCLHGRMEVNSANLELVCNDAVANSVFQAPSIRCAVGSRRDSRGRCKRTVSGRATAHVLCQSLLERLLRSAGWRVPKETGWRSRRTGIDGELAVRGASLLADRPVFCVALSTPIWDALVVPKFGIVSGRSL